MLAKPGDQVRAGEPLLELHADDPALFDRAEDALEGGIEVGTSHQPVPLILDRIA